MNSDPETADEVRAEWRAYRESRDAAALIRDEWEWNGKVNGAGAEPYANLMAWADALSTQENTQ